MEPLNLQDRPPRIGGDLWVWRLKANQEVIATIVSRHVEGLMVHWDGDHSEPCYLNTKTCPGHKRGLPLRWKGYLHIWHHTRQTEGFIEVTPKGFEQLVELFGAEDNFRGTRMSFKRGNGDKTRLKLVILPPSPLVRELPAPKSVLPSLLRMWGLEDVDGIIQKLASKFAG